jgi:RimJ/RimL family protein N-acetyltransferase
MIPPLATARLEMRPFSDADTDILHRLWTMAGVRDYLWDGEIIARERALATVREAVSDSRRSGIGMWTLRLAGDTELAGFCGFRWVGGIAPEIELLYGLRPDLWGRGLVTEAAAAALTWVFNAKEPLRVLAGTDPGNVRSVKVLERLGFAPLEERFSPSEKIRYFALTRETWRLRRLDFEAPA